MELSELLLEVMLLELLLLLDVTLLLLLLDVKLLELLLKLLELNELLLDDVLLKLLLELLLLSSSVAANTATAVSAPTIVATADLGLITIFTHHYIAPNLNTLLQLPLPFNIPQHSHFVSFAYSNYCHPRQSIQRDSGHIYLVCPYVCELPTNHNYLTIH